VYSAVSCMVETNIAVTTVMEYGDDSVPKHRAMKVYIGFEVKKKKWP
jgi:hypothetical protein